MNFGPSKKELLETIEVQKKHLLQYQTRLRDVVRAYKSLLKEKEALEASVKVLSVSQEADRSLQSVEPGPVWCSDFGDEKCSLHSEDSAGTMNSVETAASVSSSVKGEQSEDPAATETSSLKCEEANGSESGTEHTVTSDGDRKTLQLRSQLATLTNALATVTQEKSRMEASYVTDKKKTRQEFEDLIRTLEESNTKHEAEMKRFQEQLSEAKARIITQQHERSQEQSDHASMLRELQKLLHLERASRHDVELKLEETKEVLTSKSQAAERANGCESQVKQLSQEVAELKQMLHLAEEEKKKPDPQVQELEEEMSAAKNHFQAQLQLEMWKAAQAEEQLQQYSQMEEERVSNLEARVSELSDLLGAYDKSKQRDQITVQKLKERIMQLDMENKTLAIAASRRAPMDVTLDASNLDINILRDRIEKLKKMLLLAMGSSQEPLDIEKLCKLEITSSGDTSDGEKASVFYYQQELKQLKEEFERYKMRAQVVLKNKTAKDGSTSKELESVREQLWELKEKYIALRLICDDMETKHKCEMEAKTMEIIQLQQAQKTELDRITGECHERVVKLEEEMHKHRDRTMAVLAEKDRDSESLRLGSNVGRRMCSESRACCLDQEDLQNDLCQDILKHAIAGPNEPALLHYTEQAARKELEVVTLRKQKHKMETMLQQWEDNLLMEKEQHKQDVDRLQDQIQKCLRDKKREGANLEYVKNIIYRFLTLQDSLGRYQTLTAILTILHFSPQEKEQVLQQQRQGGHWWGSAKR